MVFRDMS